MLKVVAISFLMSIKVKKIYRYPIKGLTAESMSSTVLKPAQSIMSDRRFALTLGTTPNTSPMTEWMPKTAFLSLMKHEKLAKLRAHFDDKIGILSIERSGKLVAKGNITSPIGRALIEDFFSAYMGEETQGRPKLVECEHNSTLSDHYKPVISIINLSSIKDLERVTLSEINPIRFRANIYVDGIEPWTEFNLVGKNIKLGSASLKITKRIDRCPAINVDPDTGDRNLNLPKDLKRGFGHVDMGIYAVVTKGGNININDTLKIEKK